MMIKLVLSVLPATLSVFGEVWVDVDVNENGEPCIIGSFADEIGARQRCLRVDPSATAVWVRERPSSDVLVVTTNTAEELRIPDLRCLSSSLSDDSGSLGIGFGSDIERFAERSVMLWPGQMVIDAVSPMSYCANRAIVMLPIRRNSQGGHVEDHPVRVSLVHQDDGSQINFGGAPLAESSGMLSWTFERTTVPMSTYTAIQHSYLMHSGGAQLEDGDFACGPIMNRLPAIKFAFSEANIHLYPEDYLHVDPVTGFCSRRLHGTRSRYGLDIGYLALQNMVILLDYANDQMGFCDPI